MTLKFKGGITDELDDFDGLLAAILGTLLFVVFVSGWSFFVRGDDFDAEKFGNGVALIMGAGGAGYGAKRLGEKYGDRRTDSSSP